MRTGPRQVAAVMQGSRPRTIAPEELPGMIARHLKVHHAHGTGTQSPTTPQ